MSAAITVPFAAIDRDDVATYVNALFLVFIILIFIRVLLSWIPPGKMPYNPTLSAVVGFVHETTDPYLNVFRRIIPPIKGGGMMFDLSPIIAIFLLLIAQGIVVGLIAG